MDGITERNEVPSFRERFVDLICDFQVQLLYLFGIEVVFLMIALFSLLFVEPGTTSYAILQFDFIVIAAVMIPTLLILYKCNDNEW